MSAVPDAQGYRHRAVGCTTTGRRYLAFRR